MLDPDDVATTCMQAATVMREVADVCQAIGLTPKARTLRDHAVRVEVQGENAEDHPGQLDTVALGDACSDAIEQLKQVAELLRAFGLIDDQRLARRCIEHLGRLHYECLTTTQPVDVPDSTVDSD